MDYLRYYDLEEYLFSDVQRNFHLRGYLTREEFFSIVVWKANRAKGRIRQLLERRGTDLTKAIRTLTNEIHGAPGDRQRLALLLEQWGFRLPMASAILAVLYPTRFSVYDVRVRSELGIWDFAGRKGEIEHYFDVFLHAVSRVPEGRTLRDKDRYLWGKSAYEDLQRFINEG